jgi:hypothetical protein
MAGTGRTGHMPHLAGRSFIGRLRLILPNPARSCEVR